MNAKRVLFLSIALGGVGAMHGASAQQASCDRTCLGGLLDRYLNAIVAHDPESAPLFVGFRQTENAVVVRRGAGMWQGATGLGEVQRRFFDPVTGQAAFFGIVDEGPDPAIVSLRVKVERREITEAEWYIARRGDPGINGPVAPGQTGGNLYDVENLIASQPPQRTVPRSERLPREALIAITNSYFDGLTTHDGSIIQAHAGCLRVENGLQTTGRPLAAGSTDGHDGRTHCMSNLGGFGIALVAGRRYPLVDEEAQVVLGLAVFLRSPGSAQRRNGLSEFFYIDGGKIREIHAAMFYPAPDQPYPNWPPYDGHFPLPAASAGLERATDSTAAATGSAAASAVGAATEAWAAAYNSHDPARILARYDNEAVFWGTGSRTLRDTGDEILEYFARMPARPTAHVAIGEHRVREFGDIAINTGFYTFSEVVGGDRVERSSRFSFTYRLRDGEWLIVDHHSSRVPAAN